MNYQKNKAINLMSEYLDKIHQENAQKSKIEGFENEFNTIKHQVIDYLNFLRKAL
jgi:oligoribonuclease (3'-5' exoribonuclease)